MRVASRYPVTPRSQLLFSYPSRTRLFPSPLFRASLVLTTTPRQARNFGLHLAAAAGDVEPASGARRAREGSGEAQAAAAAPTAAVAGPDPTCARRARDPTRAATASEIDCHFSLMPSCPSRRALCWLPAASLRCPRARQRQSMCTSSSISPRRRLPGTDTTHTIPVVLDHRHVYVYVYSFFFSLPR